MNSFQLCCLNYVFLQLEPSVELPAVFRWSFPRYFLSQCCFIEPTCDFPQERHLCASFGYKWDVLCSSFTAFLRYCSCPELGHGATVVWRWESLFFHLTLLIIGATGGEQWQCCRLLGGMAAGTTALTRMMQDLGRTISLMHPFLQGCSRSISAACL